MLCHSCYAIAAMPCHAMPCHAMPCHAMLCYAMLCMKSCAHVRMCVCKHIYKHECRCGCPSVSLSKCVVYILSRQSNKFNALNKECLSFRLRHCHLLPKFLNLRLETLHVSCNLKNLKTLAHAGSTRR